MEEEAARIRQAREDAAMIAYFGAVAPERLAQWFESTQEQPELNKMEYAQKYDPYFQYKMPLPPDMSAIPRPPPLHGMEAARDTRRAAPGTRAVPGRRPLVPPRRGGV